MRPQFYQYKEIGLLRKNHPELEICDQVDLALDELFDIEFPLKKDTKTLAEVQKYSKQITLDNPEEWGEWVYYPWLNKLVHLPPLKEFRALRTSRNRNLITADEQFKLYNASLLIIGMSVGSNIVEALVSQGIGGTLLLVDLDIIEPSNLNRIRAPYYQVGLNKVEAISRKVWEIDPFINIVSYNEGINEGVLADIMSNHRIDVVVDEMDDLRMKVLLREACKARSLPVLMAADDGDDSLLDIERYDLDDDLKLFSGRVPQNVLERIKEGGLSRPEIGMMIGKYFVGPDNIPLRMFQSLSEVGKSLPSWPQLGGAAALSGVAVAYSAKKILLQQRIKSGRILISLDEKINLEHLDPSHQAELNRFQQMMMQE